MILLVIYKYFLKNFDKHLSSEKFQDLKINENRVLNLKNFFFSFFPAARSHTATLLRLHPNFYKIINF